MKCNRNNSCKSNPKRHNDFESRSRNYIRQPVMGYEHGECPFRIDGKCTNPEVISAHIGDLRKMVKVNRWFIDFKKGKYELKYSENSDYFKIFKDYFGGRFVSAKDVDRVERYFYDPERNISGLKDFMKLKDILNRDLNYFIKENICPYGWDKLFEKFISFKIWDNKEIVLYGNADDFDTDNLEIVEEYYEYRMNLEKYNVVVYLEVTE